jgi:1A family penicillin-binding protein
MTKQSRHRAADGYSAGMFVPRTKSRIGKFFSYLFASSAVCAAGLALMLLYLRSQALPAVHISQSSQIYDIHGKLIDVTHAGQNRQFVPLDEISPHLVHAVIAIEDHRFYEHFGLDPRGIARSALVNLRSMSFHQGSSTITMQLARNLYLNMDRTWGRKLKEAMYAVQLELKLSKDQILESYLNHIYFGLSTYGVEAASQMYFGKRAKDLTLAESALLAGIPKGPKYFSPYFDMDNALARQKLILDAMVRYNYITPDEERRALEEKLVILPPQKDRPDFAPYFRDYVRSIAIDRLGVSEELFDGGGLKIYTTLDPEFQRSAEETINRYLQNNADIQTALVSIDPRNGYIKAMVGGRDYAANQFNRAVAGRRQPGSSFKPVVYLTALMHGFTPVTRVNSEPTTFTYDDGRQTYTPANFNDRYFGSIDLREAIARSDNIYAVTALMQVGADKVIATARRLGITSPLEPLPSLALGAFPVTPLEMASAYGILANQGVRVEPTAILRIETSDGKVLYEAQPAKEQAVDPAYTYVLTNLMESVFEEGGTGSRVADTLKRPAAGKTGTTDTDSWMIGFTPELSTAVWIGYDRDRKISAVESHLAAPIFAEYTERALRAIPPKLFQIPEGVVNVYIDPATGKLANEACPNSRLESFIAGTEPTEYCTEHGEGKSAKGKDGKPAPRPNRSWWEDLKRWWNS